MLEPLDYDVFMKWAREEFDNSYKAHQTTDLWPFETPFPDDYHFIGDDHNFTERANKQVHRFGPRIHKEGIRIPSGEISVISFVRKSEAYQQEVEEGGVWTFDRVRELPRDHPIVLKFRESATPESLETYDGVRQWFVIGRFQATPTTRPPVFLFLYGFCDFKVEDAVMGGVFVMTRWTEVLFNLEGASPERIREVEHSLAYECCETLRQVAAIVYLDK
jgi:hypothetical protein